MVESDAYRAHLCPVVSRNRTWRSYQALLKFVPEFRQKTLTRSEVSRRLYYRHVGLALSLVLANLSLQLTTGANAAKSDDINRVKSKVAEWINARPGIAESQRLILSKKIGRGLQNDVTGGLLCPVKYDWDDLRWAAFCDHRLSIIS